MKARRLILLVLAAAGLTACGAILGIEDATDLVTTDGGSDAFVIPDNAPACSSTCAVVPPEGWDGPFAYSEVNGGASPTAAECGVPFTRPAYTGSGALVAPPAACTCSCAGATEVGCSPFKANLFTDAPCATPCGPPNQPVSATCSPIDQGMCPNNFRIVLTASTPAGGKCEATASSHADTAVWTAAYRLCALPSPIVAKCEAGKVCVPSPSLPQKPGTLCVARPGELECPAAYPTKKVAYEGFNDARGCTPCTCGSVHDATCSQPTSTVYDGPACTAGPHVTAPAACTNQNPKSAILASAPVASGGTCDAQGGETAGEATPTTPTTICCTGP